MLLFELKDIDFQCLSILLLSYDSMKHSSP